MERDHFNIDKSHDGMKFTMQSSAEFVNWQRVFPEIMPATHTLSHSWSTNDRGQAVLTVQPTIKTNSPTVTVAGDLNGLSDGDLATIAAEEGVRVTGKMSRAQVIAAIAEKREGKE